MFRQWFILSSILIATIAFSEEKADSKTPQKAQASITAKVLWKAEVNAGFSSVVVQQDRLYTMGNKSNKDTIFCLNAKTGKVIWKYTYACKMGKYKGSHSTPLLDKNKLYVINHLGTLLCLDAEAGKLLWKKNVLKETKNNLENWQMPSSPLIIKDLIILNMGSSGVALQKETGKIVWQSKGKSGHISPVILNSRGYIALYNGKRFNIIKSQTGTIIKYYDWKLKSKINEMSPLVIEDKLFLSSSYEDHCTLIDFSSKEPTVVWENTEIKEYFNSSIVYNGYIYGIDGQAKRESVFRCLSANDGSATWSEKTIFSSIILAKDLLIQLDEKGTLHFILLDSDHFKELYTFKTGLKKFCWALPVFKNNIIYCRNGEGTLVAVEMKKSSSTKEKKTNAQTNKK